MSMNAKRSQRWQRTRQMGRSRYIRLYGVLGWGLSTGIVWALVMAARLGWDNLPILLPVALVAFPIGGYFFGVLTWRMFEAQFERTTSTPADA